MLPERQIVILHGNKENWKGNRRYFDRHSRKLFLVLGKMKLLRLVVDHSLPRLLVRVVVICLIIVETWLTKSFSTVLELFCCFILYSNFHKLQSLSA